MATSAPLYDYSIVPFKRSLSNMIYIMTKAERYAQENGVDVETYTKLRICSDMGDFTFQIQRLSDSAKFAYSRLSKNPIDKESLSMPDVETTWQQLKDRLSRTITILDHAKTEDFIGQEEKEVGLFGGQIKFKAQEYLQVFAGPNFYFHATTAYDLLRGVGVPLAKVDFIRGGER